MPSPPSIDWQERARATTRPTGVPDCVARAACETQICERRARAQRPGAALPGVPPEPRRRRRRPDAAARAPTPTPLTRPPRKPSPPPHSHRGRGPVHVHQLVGQPHEPGRVAQAPGEGTREREAPVMCRCTFPCGGRGWFSSVARSVRPPRSRRPPPLSLSLSPHPPPPPTDQTNPAARLVRRRLLGRRLRRRLWRGQEEDGGGRRARRRGGQGMSALFSVKETNDPHIHDDPWSDPPLSVPFPSGRARVCKTKEEVPTG